MEKTKKVRITLSALTRVEFTEILEVPADMTDEELNDLVDQRCDEVDGGEYTDDPHFWEKGDSCGWDIENDPRTVPGGKVARDNDGTFVVKSKTLVK